MNWEAIFWLIAMVVFAVAEAMTVSLVSIWFAVGALGAILVALTGGGLAFQVTVFLALAVALLLSLRGIVRKHFTPRVTRTNVDSVIGATGVVLTPVNNIAALGHTSALSILCRRTAGVRDSISSQVFQPPCLCSLSGSTPRGILPRASRLISRAPSGMGIKRHLKPQPCQIVTVRR